MATEAGEPATEPQNLTVGPEQPESQPTWPSLAKSHAKRVSYFLENMVKRLSTELAQRQAESHEDAALTETELLVDDGAPLPVWLKDRKYLNPLLAAYDEKIAVLESEAAHRNAAVGKLEQQVEAVIAENEGLRGELTRSVESQALAAAMAEGAALAPDGSMALMREEAQLLRQENDLLVSQQGELDGEIQRLHSQLSQQSQQAVALAQENAALMARMQQQTAGVQATEAKQSRMHTQLKAAVTRANRLSQQVAEMQAQLDDERITAETASRQLSELQHIQSALQSDALASAQAARAAADKQAAAQVSESKGQAELHAARDRYEVMSRELSLSQSEVTDLRQSLSKMEAQLAEYKRKDVEAFTRVRQAVEVAEAAQMSRDAHASRQADLEREVDTLQQRLATVRQAVRSQVYSELQGTLHDLRTELSLTQDQLKAAEMQVSEHRSAAERATRECGSMTAELAALKEDLGETLSSKSKVTLISLTTMERIQEVERERDEAAQKYESCHRQLERLGRDWTLEKQTMEAELRSVRKALNDKESAATHATSEAAGLSRQVEALVAEVNALREAHARTEAELRQQVSSARAERDMEIRAMANRLEGALAACARSVSEAERMLEGKDALLARWKEEATLVAGKMERALADHRRDLDAREHIMEELRSQVQALHVAHSDSAAEAEELRGVLPGMQAAIQDAEARSAQLHMQLMNATAREEELTQEVRSLQSLMDRARFDGSGAKRVDRVHDDLTAKLRALRNAGLGHGVVGVAVSTPASTAQRE